MEKPRRRIAELEKEDQTMGIAEGKLREGLADRLGKQGKDRGTDAGVDGFLRAPCRRTAVMKLASNKVM
jgi:hypothetical protein